MDSDREEQHQHVHGVVIITLPPPDNPSKGKTITAFTLTDNDYAPTDQLEEDPNHGFEADPHRQNSPSGLGSSDLFLDSPRRVLALLGISLLAIVLCGSVFSDTVRLFRFSYEKDDEKGDRNTMSFVFPVYHKLGARNIPERDLAASIGEVVAVGAVNSAEAVDGEMAELAKVNGIVSSRAGSAESSTVFPVSGNVSPDGLYFTQLIVGDNNRFHLDVDTGSDLTWIQCDAPCISCAKGANPLYKPRKDKLVRPMDSLCIEVQRNLETTDCEDCQQCDYEIEYADHSSSMGVLTRDELHLKPPGGSLTKSDIVFGCGYDQQGLLLNTLGKTDGILGLSGARSSLPSQLASQGIIKNVVGHCLASDVNGEGYMFLGNDFVPQHGMTWFPMRHYSDMEFYHTDIEKMNYGGTPLSLDRQHGRVGRVVFDTGSSYTYFPEEAYSELVASLQEVLSLELTLDGSDTTLPFCWKASFPIRSVKDVSQFFKTITLQLGSKWWIVARKLPIPPEGYLIISSKGNVCLGILDGSNVHDGSAIILGDISLRGQLMVYDNVKRRIGWMRSDCVQPHEFQTYPFYEG